MKEEEEEEEEEGLRVRSRLGLCFFAVPGVPPAMMSWWDEGTSSEA